MGSDFKAVHPDDLFRDLFQNLDKYIDLNATALPVNTTTPVPISVNATSECDDRWWTPSYYQCDSTKAVGLYFVCFVLIILVVIGIIVLLLVCCCYACSSGAPKEVTWKPPTQPVIVENHHHHHHGPPQITVTSAHSVPSVFNYRPP